MPPGDWLDPARAAGRRGDGGDGWPRPCEHFVPTGSPGSWQPARPAP